ncbi:outer membrane protein [Polynucleobacter sp. MWH-Jannik1A5]|jgi:opacity protein-like surface antigen|uniref:outer membrane protein n=1 Tax=Polynucleobacter sp. MWH-Jannik1A5 TaxID=1855890 RepID=UPI001C0E80F0|nr:outer membrane beta-barrel protein [Polynucleobacter sp. MWH-Jannik1A5]MBU3546379.1 outer membrane beta-barrel protein [Polynucleobacter sp. MWH-Jannik1A5]
MKKLFISLLLAVTPFGAAFAEGAFDGVNLQLGLGASMTKSQQSQNLIFDNSDPGPGSSFTANKTNFVGSISLGYSYGFANNLNLAANVFYNASSNDVGSNVTGFSDGSTMTRTMNLKNVMGISIEPGYYFSKDILGFLKLGVAQASSSMSYSFSDGGSVDPINFGNTTGFLYGLGGKYAVTQNIYVGAELYQINFSKKTYSERGEMGGYGPYTFSVSNQPTYNYAGLTLGYRF